MTEKVKLTREQERQLLTWKSNYPVDVIVQLVIDGNCSISKLSRWQIVKCLYAGYEVEEEYKVGDWKKVQLANRKWVIGKIDTIAFEDIIFNYLDEDLVWRRVTELAKCSFDPTPEEIKAEQERRTWAKIGRKPREFKLGDAYENKLGAIYTFDKVERLSVIRDVYEKGNLRGFYPAESFISFGSDPHD